MTLAIPRFDTRDWDRDPSGTPLRFAVVGLGSFARDVALPAIEASSYCTTTAVVSGSETKAESVAAEFEVRHALTYDDYEDGVARDDYDAVYLATPNALHLPHVRPAAEFGKQVLCEKPLEATAERAARLVEVCDDAGVTLMTAYRMQTTPSVRWVRQLVRDGAIGDPVQVHGEFSMRYLDVVDSAGWRTDPEMAGGGALMDIGVYPMNTARFVLGDDPVAVRASTASDHEAFEDVDEHVAFQLEFPDGVTASCTASFDAAQAERLAILGTTGRIVVEPIFEVAAERQVTVERAGDRITVDVTEPSEVVEEFDYFATVVLGGEPLGPDGDHGLTDVRIAEAIYESSENGTRVTL